MVVVETYDSYFAFIAQPMPHLVVVVVVVMSATGTSAALVKLSPPMSVITEPGLPVKEVVLPTSGAAVASEMAIIMI